MTDSEERQTLLPNDTPVLQGSAAPMRLNIITGTAILAQAGLFALLIGTWYTTATQGDWILVSYHPLLTTLAVVLSIQAILLLQPTVTQEQKRDGTRAHSVLNALAVASLLSAVVIMFINKANHGAPHFASVHGKLGLSTLVLLVVQAIVGIVQYYLPALVGGEARGKALYRYHRASGYAITALLLVTATYGTQTDWFLQKTGRHILPLWIVIDIAIVAGVVPRIRPAKMKLF